MRVVPVSMAETALSPLEMETSFPLRLRPAIINKFSRNSLFLREINQQYMYAPVSDKSQNVSCPDGMLTKSMSPVKSEELVPPRVNTPPLMSCWRFVTGALSNQKENSGDVNWFELTKACQNGTAFVSAIPWNASPRIPETSPSSRP